MEDQNLIVAVCSRPVLYDTTMVSYRDRNKKERAWVDVAEDTGFPGFGKDLVTTKMHFGWLKITSINQIYT
ncbi:unnamed protein product [Boreogadus saida]